MPNIYRAETSILPPQQSSSSMATQILSQLGGAASLAGNMLGVSTPADLYVGMLKSRTIYDNIIRRFNLQELYETDTIDETRKALDDHVDIEADKKSGIITVAVEDEDPKKAADMANAFVEELKKLTKQLALTEASQRRIFFEEQLKEAKKNLTKAEEDMARFQTRTGALQIDEQAKAVIEAIAALKAQIAEKEVELKVMKTYSTPNNPDLQKLEEALKGLHAELRKLEATSKTKGYDPLMPARMMPEVGTEYLRKLRELKFQETLYELLLKQYEVARMDEARDAVIVQVIDRAIPPEKKTKPKRTLMVAVATVTGGFLSIFLAFVMEFFETASHDPENRERIAELKKYLSIKGRKK
jgi:uncharacterized protein involved in exopolysaccharide biosynthesis